MNRKMHQNIWKSPFNIRFQKKKYFLEWGSNPRKYHIFRAEIEKIFVRFLVQMKRATSPFEINWPLGVMNSTEVMEGNFNSPWVAKPQVVKNKIPHESRVALPRVTNGEFYPIPFSPWWRTDIPILHTKFWTSILHTWGIDVELFNFSTIETISIPHTLRNEDWKFLHDRRSREWRNLKFPMSQERYIQISPCWHSRHGETLFPHKRRSRAWGE